MKPIDQEKYKELNMKTYLNSRWKTWTSTWYWFYNDSRTKLPPSNVFTRMFKHMAEVIGWRVCYKGWSYVHVCSYALRIFEMIQDSKEIKCTIYCSSQSLSSWSSWFIRVTWQLTYIMIVMTWHVYKFTTKARSVCKNVTATKRFKNQRCHKYVPGTRLGLISYSSWGDYTIIYPLVN